MNATPQWAWMNGEYLPWDQCTVHIRTQVVMMGAPSSKASGPTGTPNVDRIPVGNGKMGELTETIQKIYFDVARGNDPVHPEWRTPVYGRELVS